MIKAKSTAYKMPFNVLVKMNSKFSPNYQPWLKLTRLSTAKVPAFKT